MAASGRSGGRPRAVGDGALRGRQNRDQERRTGARRFHARLLAAALFVLLCFGLLGWRLVHLQVVRHDELALQAEANRIAVVPIVPNRGLIVDRNGVVLATNYSAYTLEITPSRAVQGDLDADDRQPGRGDRHQTRDRRRFKRLHGREQELRIAARSAPS
jgi:cell division protein FtsI/penicillin-binding protein 2